MAMKRERSARRRSHSRAKSDRSRKRPAGGSRTAAALQERVKELTCLYDIAKLRVEGFASLDDLLQGVVELLPPAWQHSAIASARITVDGRCYQTPRAMEVVQKQSADIVVAGIPRGTVEVGYRHRKPALDEGPFSKEERRLLDTVAREVGLVLERRRSEDEGARLQDQLRHADRLATIGQLAAGIAHELNEPLGSILGFAQLTAKTEGLPEQASRDLDKIIRATLRAREILKNLMLFARQMPPKKVGVDLNRIVQEGLEFLEPRYAQGGIELSREFDPNLPELTADPSLLLQVVVNLAVNAMQAMPDGGRLTLRTSLADDKILLVVEDEGLGMSEEVKRRIFVPFFTTKGVGKGTGLGLAVVHGIVTSHGGSIRVESREGGGTRFEVSLPLQTPQKVARHG